MTLNKSANARLAKKNESGLFTFFILSVIKI